MSDQTSLNIRLYQPGDDEIIVELLKKTFPKWAEFNDSLGLWRWKYINTPMKSLIIVAFVDDKLVGCNHSIIVNVKLGSKITALRWDDDTAVDIDYRGLGIWSKIFDYKVELGYLKLFGYYTTENPIIINQGRKNNWVDLHYPVTRMMKTHDIDQQLQLRPMKNKSLVKLGYHGFKSLNNLTNLFKSPIKQLSDFQIVTITEFDEKMDSFWTNIKDDYEFILEKKHEYLNWRFTDNDRGNYVKYIAVDPAGDVLGYVVVGYKVEESEGQIVDLIALKDRLDVVDALFDCGCEYLDDLGVNTVYYQIVVGHPYYGFSRRKGFIDTRSRPFIQFSTERASEMRQLLHNITPSQLYFNYSTTF